MNGKKECNKHQIYHTHSHWSVKFGFQSLHQSLLPHSTSTSKFNDNCMMWWWLYTHTLIWDFLTVQTLLENHTTTDLVCLLWLATARKKTKKTSQLKIVTNQNMIKLKSVVVCCCCFHILQIYGTTRSFFLVASQIHQRLWWSSKES